VLSELYELFLHNGVNLYCLLLFLYKMIVALHIEQSGAVEACWAHNPEVRGSKPRSARILFQYFYVRPICDSSARLAKQACAKLFESLH
jgi:hypothetical protein